MPTKRVMATVALGLMVAVGCGGDDEAGGDAGDAMARLTIVATDPTEDEAALEAPTTIEAGLTQVRLTNAGDTLHDAQLFRIDGDHTAEELVDELLESVDSAPKPDWAHPVGGIAALRPTESRDVLQVLEPGRYLIADTQERSTGPGGKLTNAAKGGVAEVEVTGDGGGTLPRPPSGARVTATDKGFETDAISAGVNRTVRFENTGQEWHQAVFFRVPRGQTYREAGQELFDRRSDTGWVPVDVSAAHATAVLEGGGAQLVDISFEPGRYLIACFVSDRAGGAAHFATTLSGFEVR